MTTTLTRSVRYRQAAVPVSGAEELPAVVFQTELGWMALAWHHAKLDGATFGYNSARAAEQALVRLLRTPHASLRTLDEQDLDNEPQWVGQLVRSLRQFAKGVPVEFAGVPLSLGQLTPFGRRVVAACRRIGWGETRSYGHLAAVCGSPGAARAVGSVMAKNRFPIIVPCHRVVGSGGSLGGYSAPDGLRMKRRLLAMESSEQQAR